MLSNHLPLNKKPCCLTVYSGVKNDESLNSQEERMRKWGECKKEGSLYNQNVQKCWKIKKTFIFERRKNLYRVACYHLEIIVGDTSPVVNWCSYTLLKIKISNYPFLFKTCGVMGKCVGVWCVCVEEREKKEGGGEREKGIQVTAKVLSVKKLRWKKELNVIPWKMWKM